ncbi:MAG: hypothetical protein K9K66_14045 [Desulfarculaceae bacterium]|nr:hypothetical protein [Desulfarculaceae bacterium]MCF8074193.1 hypothetical protein [Desulfarculaceae bacterium]MCF8102774.1 hypothetical protein [Desulfarculaceae bacterium]MCF8116371.1 hypothetical protein [Desulfarculaceae bacterium]
MPRLSRLAVPLFLSLVAVLCLAPASALAKPCLVVATVPAAGAAKISPGLKAVSVTFNQAMVPGSWSFVKNPKLGRFPKLAGQPKFTSPNTCLLPVALEPGVTYAIGINTEGYGNFRAAATPKTPCASYQMIFTTGR